MKFALLLLSCIPALIYSQGIDNSKKSKFQFGIGIESNFFKIPNLNGKWNDINPNFIDPSIEDTAYKSFDGNLHSSNKRYNFSFQMKQNLKNSKFSFAPRINLAYGEGLRTSQSWNKSISNCYDTLTSNTSDQKLYLDSTVFDEQHFSFYSKSISCRFGVNLDYEFSNRFTFYAGIEFGIAKFFSISENNIHNTYYKKSIADGTFYAGINQELTSQNITYNNKNASYLPLDINQINLGIPLGIKFRLSKKENFLNHFLLSYEYNFNQSYFNISSVYQKSEELAKFNQFQHSHLFRIIYEI